MRYAPAAPPEIWEIEGISDGAKLTLMHWWGKADHASRATCEPCTVWAPAAVRPDGTRMTPTESLFEDLRKRVHAGKADRTLRGYVAELRRAGLAHVDGRCVDLANPAVAETRQEPADFRSCGGGSIETEPGENWPVDVRKMPVDGRNLPSQLNHPSPPNFTQQPPKQTASGAQASLPLVDDIGPPAPTQKAPKRDPVGEVIAYWTERVAETRQWAGLTRTSGLTWTAELRGLIADRIKSAGGGDDGVTACKRVIDVQEAQARSHGVCLDPARRSEWTKSTGWKFWRPSTLFRKDNFSRWLERWSEDGDHEVWGPRQDQRRVADTAGRNDALREQIERQRQTGAVDWGTG